MLNGFQAQYMREAQSSYHASLENMSLFWLLLFLLLLLLLIVLLLLLLVRLLPRALFVSENFPPHRKCQLKESPGAFLSCAFHQIYSEATGLF